MSSKLYNKSVFIFRRDLRIHDNTGLIQALNQSKKVIPCFIFDPIQVGSENEYKTDNGIQFMIESLKDLQDQLNEKNGKLYLFYGDTQKIIASIIKNTAAEAIFLNYDYTPFSVKRDANIEKLCKKNDINFHGHHDALLIGDPSLILTGSNTPYSVYSAFYRKASTQKVDEPKKIPQSADFYTSAIVQTESSAIYKKVLKENNPNIKVHGGRSNSLKILRSLDGFKDYSKERDIPAKDATTHLSASHKFGTVSIRESYHAIKKALGSRTQLLKELYWRDFFTYVAWHSPFVFGKPFHKKYDDLWWSKSKNNFDAWCEGKTGFPIVDAGMRELNETGFMQNRVRMITASFLTKDLHINWIWGEKYFAQQLVDYDPAVNNGNWQWCASTGCDAQPYFRIFNPWTQQKRFDPECTYIKKWIPELKKVDPKIINSWFKENHAEIPGYPRPIVDHDIERKKALAYYKKA